MTLEKFLEIIDELFKALNQRCKELYLQSLQEIKEFFKTPNQRRKEILKWYMKKYLEIQGALVDDSGQSVPYHVVSVDGGKSWYHAEETEDGMVKILGPEPKELAERSKWTLYWSSVLGRQLNPTVPEDAKFLRVAGLTSEVEQDDEDFVKSLNAGIKCLNIFRSDFSLEKLTPQRVLKDALEIERENDGLQKMFRM